MAKKKDRREKFQMADDVYIKLVDGSSYGNPEYATKKTATQRAREKLEALREERDRKDSLNQ